VLYLLKVVDMALLEMDWSGIRKAPNVTAFRSIDGCPVAHIRVASRVFFTSEPRLLKQSRLRKMQTRVTMAAPRR
jgi:hypothetical protein